MNICFYLVLAGLTVSNGLQGGDCNRNGVDDLQDVSGFFLSSVLDVPALWRGNSNFVVADVDGDLDVDLVHQDGSFLLNQGEGTFHLARGLDLGGQVIAADFDKNGRKDLAVYHDRCSGLFEEPGTVTVFLSFANGNRVRKDYAVEYLCPHPFLTVFDANGDGNVDIVMLMDGGYYISCIVAFLNDGTGTFGSLTMEDLIGLGDGVTNPIYVSSLTTTDLDGDQESDLIVGHHNGGVGPRCPAGCGGSDGLLVFGTLEPGKWEVGSGERS